MAFIHKYCQICGGEIVLGSDGTIWESFCCCESMREQEEKDMERQRENARENEEVEPDKE